MRRAVLALAAAATPLAAMASEGSKYSITPVEKAACMTDAIRLCRHTYPDEDRLLGCMRGNMTNLSLVCSVAFKAGLKKRGISL